MASLTTRIFGFIFVFGVLSSAKTVPKPLSAYFNVCKRGDVKTMNECIMKSLETAKPLLKKGIPSIGLVPLKPLVVPRIELAEGSGNFFLKTTLVNFVSHGMDEYNVTKVRTILDEDIFKLDIEFTFPTLNITADYEIDGNVLILPIQGKGFCEMKFTDVKVLGATRGNYNTKNGETYIDIFKVDFDIHFDGKNWMWFHNLFNGDERLGNATNAFLNSNDKDASDAFKHLPEEAFGEIIRQQMKRVFELYGYPLSQLLPEP